MEILLFVVTGVFWVAAFIWLIVTLSSVFEFGIEDEDTRHALLWVLACIIWPIAAVIVVWKIMRILFRLKPFATYMEEAKRNAKRTD